MKIIHINRNVIQHNSKHDNQLPVCRVEDGKDVRYCMEVHIHGYSKMIYRPDNPRPCGAKLWIETDAPVVLVDEMPWDDIKEGMKLPDPPKPPPKRIVSEDVKFFKKSET